VAAVSLTGAWSRHLAFEALREPLAISAAVLAAGWAFDGLRVRLLGWVQRAEARLGTRAFMAAAVLGLGLLSSLITAIVAALILAEVVLALRLERRGALRLSVLGCLAIGLGAVLTPLGEPLAALAVARLRGEPHHADFFFLARLLGAWVLPLVALSAALCLGLDPRKDSAPAAPGAPEGLGPIALRAFKVYVFVAALVLLGHGFAPLAERYLLDLDPRLLYWVNVSSAALDNATLAAAEITPRLPRESLADLLLGLLLSGIMLIPGNIPNIICANKLGLRAREWASVGAPLGFVLMLGVFLLRQL
jgi:predicted cation transporter